MCQSHNNIRKWALMKMKRFHRFLSILAALLIVVGLFAGVGQYLGIQFPIFTQAAYGESHAGIIGQPAPELGLTGWIDGEGRNMDPMDPDSATIPLTMKKYRSGGTPWTVIINPAGQVVYNQFHIKVDQAVALITDLM